ncbi:hypothetical protein RHMOL_Rhmol02G0160400 [Rhododendron molle]|uniref:Uncharacterized protein n=1 Tax=Rhododendron molle TaxID=49168 RepID=A0ACC0PT33_RHOML|nr:hypothetical protein RHMOL_Rhmol02G0160400 [Rhododendron molle]
MAKNILPLKNIDLDSKNYTVEAIIVKKGMPKKSAKSGSQYQRFVLQDIQIQDSSLQSGKHAIPLTVMIHNISETFAFYRCIANASKIKQLPSMTAMKPLMLASATSSSNDPVKIINLPTSVEKALTK